MIKIRMMKKICFLFLLLTLNAFSLSAQGEIEKLQRRVDEQGRIIKSMQQEEEAQSSRMLLCILISGVVVIIVSGFFMWKIKKITRNQTPEKIEKPATVSVAEEKVQYKKLSDDLGGRPDSSPRSIPKVEKLTAKECVQKGKDAYDREEYQKAIGYFNEAFTLNPDTYDRQSAFYYRGLSKYQMSNYIDAIKDFDAAEKEEETDYIYFIRGTAYFFLDRLPEALKDMENAIRLSPDYDSAIEYRKDILEKMKK